MNLSELKGTTITHVRRDETSLLIDFSNGAQMLINIDSEANPPETARTIFYDDRGRRVKFDPEEVPDMWRFLHGSLT